MTLEVNLNAYLEIFEITRKEMLLEYNILGIHVGYYLKNIRLLIFIPHKILCIKRSIKLKLKKCSCIYLN